METQNQVGKLQDKKNLTELRDERLGRRQATDETRLDEVEISKKNVGQNRRNRKI